MKLCKMKKTLLSICLILITLCTTAQIRLVHVDPTLDWFTVKNFGSSTVDISSYRVCASFSYSAISALTALSGSTTLAPNDIVILGGFALDATGSDIAIYNSSNFTDPADMQDFTQWGSAGNGRESVAVAKGIWTAGDFIATAGPYLYGGNGTTDNGLSFWFSGSVGVAEVQELSSVNVFPNPSSGQVNLDLVGITSDVVVSVTSMKGELVHQTVLKANSFSSLDLTDQQSGMYIISLQNDSGTERYRVCIQ